MWDPQNTDKKKIQTHEIPTRKHFGPIKKPQENILEPRNSHNKKFGPTMAQWRKTHKIHDGTGPSKCILLKDLKAFRRLY